MKKSEQDYIENDSNIEIIDTQSEDISDLQDDLDEELNSIFSEFGGGENDDLYEIRVYRVARGLGKMAYLFACLPSELPIMDRLRDEYGGGTFEIRVYKNKKIFRRRSCAVEPPLKKVSNSNSNNNQNGDQVSLIQAMQSGFDRLGDMLVNNQVPQQSATQVIEMQTATLNNMLLMKDIFSSGNNNKNIDPLNMVTKLIEIQNSLSQSDSGGMGNNLLTLANNLLPKLAEIGGREQELKAQAIRQRPARNRKTKKIESSQANNDNFTGAQNKDHNNPMQMQLIFLCLQAKMKRNPSLYAQMVIDNTPTEQLNELRKFLSGSDPLKIMGELHRPILKYPKWFKKLSSEILILMDKATINNRQPLTESKLATINNNNVISDDMPNITGVHNIAAITNNEQTKAAKKNNG